MKRCTAAAIVFTSQIGFVHKQTGRKATYLKSSVGKQNITPYFGLGGLILSSLLWCMDATKWVPHLLPTWRHPSNAVAREPMPCLSFYFNILLFYLLFYFLRIHTDSASNHADSSWTMPIRLESGCIGLIGSYQSAAEIDRNGRNRPWIMPEQSKSALNEAQTS